MKLPKVCEALNQAVVTTQQTFTRSKSTIETEKRVKYVHSKLTIKNTRKRLEVCSQLTEKHQNDVNDVVLVFFFVNSERISHLFLVFLLLTLNKYMLAGQPSFNNGNTDVRHCPDVFYC